MSVYIFSADEWNWLGSLHLILQKVFEDSIPAVKLIELFSVFPLLLHFQQVWSQSTPAIETKNFQHFKKAENWKAKILSIMITYLCKEVYPQCASLARGNNPLTKSIK